MNKWNDEENYVMKEPLWRKMLKVAAKYSDIDELQNVLLWLHNKNMQGDRIRIQTIGYYLCKLDVDLEKELAFSKEESTRFINFYNQFNTIDECVVHILKQYNIHEEIIEEFINRL